MNRIDISETIISVHHSQRNTHPVAILEEERGEAAFNTD